MTKQPTKEELESKWWYRLLIVIFWSVLVLTAIGPSILGFNVMLIDLVVGVALNGFIMIMIWKVIYFVAYGKRPQKK
jgi:hypothetical protein